MENDKRMKDLFIGNTSQLAYFWSKEDTEFISSRNIDINYIKSQQWNRIIVGFANGQTNLTCSDDTRELFNINIDYTLNLIDNIKDCCKNVIYFGTTELWNYHNGPLNIDGLNNIQIINSFDFDQYSPYINSKAMVITKLLEEDKYNNVIVLFPFSFNSARRQYQDYLFCKIFDSIINKRKIIIGNTKFYRDITHPKFVIRESLKADKHKIIGSGRLIFIYDFIKDLYKNFDMKYEDFVEEEKDIYKKDRNIFYLKSDECLYQYHELLNDTILDIYGVKYNLNGDKC